jgi:hypothetical protein
LLAIALVVGPLNYASTRPGSMWLLIAAIGLAAFCWAGALALEQRIPATPLPVLAGLLALASAAIFWIFGAELATPAAEFTRNHFARVIARWPNSVVNFEPGAVIALHAGLGLALWMTMDLARDRQWVLILAATMVVVGAIVALLAMAENMTHATGIFWQMGTRLPGRFWGTFFHHTSAGAYLNTVWPLAAGLALVAGQLKLSPTRKRVAVSLALLVLILLLGGHATHISRFPQVAAVALAPFLIVGLMRKHLFQLGRWALALPIGIVAIALIAGRTDEIARRWRLIEVPAEKSAAPCHRRTRGHAWSGMICSFPTSTIPERGATAAKHSEPRGAPSPPDRFPVTGRETGQLPRVGSAPIRTCAAFICTCNLPMRISCKPGPNGGWPVSCLWSPCCRER